MYIQSSSLPQNNVNYRDVGRDYYAHLSLLLLSMNILGVLVCSIPLALFFFAFDFLKTYGTDSTTYFGPLFSLFAFIVVIPILAIVSLVALLVSRKRKKVTMDVYVLCITTLLLIVSTMLEIMFGEIFGETQVSAVLIVFSIGSIFLYNVVRLFFK